MSFKYPVSRRQFVQSASLGGAAVGPSRSWPPQLFADAGSQQPLAEFGYGDVTLHGELHNQQLEQTHSVLMGLSEDSLSNRFAR
jgi:hypothetical protein